MHIEQLRDICLNFKSVEETFPFDEDTLVFKVLGKMFCLISLKEANSCNLKCNPERSVELRASYSAIKPGWHMDKNHWNTVTFNMDADDKLIAELVTLSYNLVVEKMPKKTQAILKDLS